MITSGKVYKVWLDIEEYDIEREEGITLDISSLSSVATFKTSGEALQFARRLQDISGHLVGKRVTHP